MGAEFTDCCQLFFNRTSYNNFYASFVFTPIDAMDFSKDFARRMKQYEVTLVKKTTSNFLRPTSVSFVLYDNTKVLTQKSFYFFAFR